VKPSRPQPVNLAGVGLRPLRLRVGSLGACDRKRPLRASVWVRLGACDRKRPLIAPRTTGSLQLITDFVCNRSSAARSTLRATLPTSAWTSTCSARIYAATMAPTASQMTSARPAPAE
jgi:hypothetical protein